MAGKSKNRKNHRSNSSSNSSDNSGDDPDFVMRWSPRLMERKNSVSINERQVVNANSEITEGESSIGKRKGGRPPNKRDREEEETRVIEIPIREKMRRRRSSNAQSSRRNRNSRKIIDDGKRKATKCSWLIDSKTIQENAEIYYMDRTAGELPIKEGKITRQGLFCSCCDEVFTGEDFEVHAGKKPNKPYENIFVVAPRVSLISCMNEAWEKPEESNRHRFNTIESKGRAGDPYDDACMICADGGNLICCDQCSSTYHPLCMAMKEIPGDSWHCPYCVCKFCGNPILGNDYLIKCSQCEKRYHWECYQERELIIIDVNSTCAPFCEQSCREVYEKLEKMIGVKNELDDGYSWTLLKRMDQDSGDNVHELYKTIECHSKLAIAWRVMQDCFECIGDRHTTIDVIQSVVYNCGSNFNRINFRTFYTAVLEKDDEIISVASVRIHGTKIAEMPFIATQEMYRRNGMCQRLMTGIESALCYLKVENLVIPSTSERIGNWIERYGFGLLEDTFKKEIMCYNTLMFHDSVRLQKNLLPMPPDLPKPITSANQAMPDREAENNDHQNEPSFRNTSTMPPFLDLNLEPLE